MVSKTSHHLDFRQSLRDRARNKHRLGGAINSQTPIQTQWVNIFDLFQIPFFNSLIQPNDARGSSILNLSSNS